MSARMLSSVKIKDPKCSLLRSLCAVAFLRYTVFLATDAFYLPTRNYALYCLLGHTSFNPGLYSALPRLLKRAL